MPPARPLTCRQFAQRKSAWRDGQRPQDDALMHEHLERCQRCAALARALDLGVEILRRGELEPRRHVGGWADRR